MSTQSSQSPIVTTDHLFSLAILMSLGCLGSVLSLTGPGLLQCGGNTVPPCITSLIIRITTICIIVNTSWVCKHISITREYIQTLSGVVGCLFVVSWWNEAVYISWGEMNPFRTWTLGEPYQWLPLKQWVEQTTLHLDFHHKIYITLTTY